jgi:putative nucleotidyltransferase with HDIG domain
MSGARPANNNQTPVLTLQETAAELSAKIESGQTLTWKLGSIKDNSYATMRREFSAVLDGINRSDLKVKLDYCLREFCVNSQKAMIKRLFFEENGSDIVDSDAYRHLMQKFRESWVQKIDDWEKKLQARQMFYQVNVQCKDGLFNLIVANPGKILPVEQARIRAQLDAALKNGDEDEIQFGVGDSEGGGLGILLIGRMIEALGCASNGLSFWVYDEKTVFMLRVPLDRQEQASHKIHQALAREIENLPSFPETLLELQSKIENPDLMLSQVAEMIRRDAGLTALVLKTANSAAFVRMKKVTDLAEAVTFIGMKGIKGLLLYHGMEKNFSGKYESFATVMEHSHKVAAIAGRLAKKFLPKQVELAYVGGLLHDMGKIIILEHPNAFARKINEFHNAEEISSWYFEHLAFGLDHAELGALVAEHWNFPAELGSMIRFHHDLSMCPAADLPLAAVICFADIASQLAAEEYPAHLIDPRVLDFFGLSSQKDVTSLANAIVSQ